MNEIKPAIDIVNVLNCPQHLDTILAWHKEEWGNEWALYASEIKNNPQTQTMFVAISNNLPSGTACITPEDLPSRPDLFNWLAGVYVNSDSRGQGLGKLLTKQAMAHAITMNMTHLYLFVYTTDLIAFYSAMGWTVYEPGLHNNQPITIMKWVL